MMRRGLRLRGLVGAVIYLAMLPVAITLAPSIARAVTIEIDDVASDRVERQRAFAAGTLPLPGTPDLAQLPERLGAQGFKQGAQLFIRVFKSESELEVWMRKDETFELLATYPICHWAGTIGPKLREGDKQNPEGFYSVGTRQLHRIGRWPRSLNLGFPNSYDRAWGRTGSYILVHGGCSSVGCFAMTNAVMAEIFALSEHALRAGQSRIPVHVFPFRMTEANLAHHVNSPWIDFWRNLKEGYDAFEESRLPPRVGICDRRYVIETVRPGEVGAAGPLALCGALRAATVEPSSQSIAPLRPPDWPRQASLQAAEQEASSAEMRSEDAVRRAQLSGRPLPPLPTLAEQVRWLAPSPEPSRHRLAREAARFAPLLSRIAPSCNTGLASCRKFLALKARIEPQRIAAAAKGRRVRPGARVEEMAGRPPPVRVSASAASVPAPTFASPAVGSRANVGAIRNTSNSMFLV